MSFNLFHGGSSVPQSSDRSHNLTGKLLGKSEVLDLDLAPLGLDLLCLHAENISVFIFGAFFEHFFAILFIL